MPPSLNEHSLLNTKDQVKKHGDSVSTYSVCEEGTSPVFSYVLPSTYAIMAHCKAADVMVLIFSPCRDHGRGHITTQSVFLHLRMVRDLIWYLLGATPLIRARALSQLA